MALAVRQDPIFTPFHITAANAKIWPTAAIHNPQPRYNESQSIWIRGPGSAIYHENRIALSCSYRNGGTAWYG